MIRADGDLLIVGEDLQTLPVLKVAGRLSIAYCKNLATIPYVEARTLDLAGLPALESVNLAGIRDGLSIVRCPKVRGVPEGTRLRTFLYVHSCDNFRVVPASLHTGGSMHLLSLPALESYPADVQVAGRHYVIGCERFAGPAGDVLDCNGAYYMDSPALVRLPRTIRCRGNLDVSGCGNLAELPEDMEIAGYLHVTGCWKLGRLPECAATMDVYR